MRNPVKTARGKDGKPQVKTTNRSAWAPSSSSHRFLTNDNPSDAFGTTTTTTSHLRGKDDGCLRKHSGTPVFSTAIATEAKYSQPVTLGLVRVVLLRARRFPLLKPPAVMSSGLAGKEPPGLVCGTEHAPTGPVELVSGPWLQKTDGVFRGPRSGPASSPYFSAEPGRLITEPL